MGMEIPPDLESSTFEMNPTTDDLIFGIDIHEGMIVLAEDPNSRSFINLTAHSTYKDLDKVYQRMALRKNRWMKVGRLWDDRTNRAFRFIGEFSDGLKTSVYAEYGSGWYVKKESRIFPKSLAFFCRTCLDGENPAACIVKECKNAQLRREQMLSDPEVQIDYNVHKYAGMDPMEHTKNHLVNQLLNLVTGPGPVMQEIDLHNAIEQIVEKILPKGRYRHVEFFPPGHFKAMGRMTIEDVRGVLQQPLFEILRRGFGRIEASSEALHTLVEKILKTTMEKVDIHHKVFVDPTPTGTFDIPSALRRIKDDQRKFTDLAKDLLEKKYVESGELRTHPATPNFEKPGLAKITFKGTYITGDTDNGVGWTVDFDGPVLRPMLPETISINDPTVPPLPVTRFEYYMDGIKIKELDPSHRCNDRCRVTVFDELMMLKDERKAEFYHVSDKVYKDALKVERADNPDILAAKKDADPDLIG